MRRTCVPWHRRLRMPFTTLDWMSGRREQALSGLQGCAMAGPARGRMTPTAPVRARARRSYMTIHVLGIDNVMMSVGDLPQARQFYEDQLGLPVKFVVDAYG